MYKEIFLDRQREYYFPIFSKKQSKNKQSLKQNKTTGTCPENVMVIDFCISHLTNTHTEDACLCLGKGPNGNYPGCNLYD